MVAGYVSKGGRYVWGASTRREQWEKEGLMHGFYAAKASHHS